MYIVREDGTDSFPNRNLKDTLNYNYERRRKHKIINPGGADRAPLGVF